MNVDDIAGDVIPTDFSKHDRLDLIFQRQHALMSKYIPIEVKNGLCHTVDCPVDLNDRMGQARLKDFFWRTTEELTEAAEAQRVHPELRSHTLEELADALHFLVEAHLLAGISPVEVIDSKGRFCKLERLVEWATPRHDLDACCFEVVYLLGCASNCLKNRPWKQNHQLTDRFKFVNFMRATIPALIDAFVRMGLTHKDIFRIYWKKSEVNQFRQRSNY